MEPDLGKFNHKILTLHMKNSILIFTLFCMLSACKRDYDKSKLGPEVIVVPESFTVNGFSANPSSFVNLSLEDPYFTCTMPQRAEFKIVVTGLLSGAQKSISGTGDFIGAENSTWTGDSDNNYMFRTGEECSVELSFHGATKKYYDTLTITGENVYPKTTLIQSFEGITFDKNGPNAATYGNYFDAPDLSKTDIKTDKLLKTCQGTQSVSFDGVDVNSGYYIGGMYFYPSSGYYTFSGYEPDSVYLNAFVYSYGDNSAVLNFSFSEDDNGDGMSNATTDDDEWSSGDLPVNVTGWSIMSVTLKSFLDHNPAIGNGVLNLNKITGFNMNMNAKVAGTRARLNVDYITVTYGKPFNP